MPVLTPEKVSQIISGIEKKAGWVRQEVYDAADPEIREALDSVRGALTNTTQMYEYSS